MKFSDLSSPAFYENPYPFYEQLRSQGALIPLAPNVVITGRYAVVHAGPGIGAANIHPVITTARN